jgi:hypothetical protein
MYPQPLKRAPCRHSSSSTVIGGTYAGSPDTPIEILAVLRPVRDVGVTKPPASCAQPSGRCAAMPRRASGSEVDRIRPRGGHLDHPSRPNEDAPATQSTAVQTGHRDPQRPLSLNVRFGIRLPFDVDHSQTALREHVECRVAATRLCVEHGAGLAVGFGRRAPIHRRHGQRRRRLGSRVQRPEHLSCTCSSRSGDVTPFGGSRYSITGWLHAGRTE